MISLVQANSTHIPLLDNSIHMCVTSPPYFALREYHTGEQKNKEIGAEDKLDCFGWVTGNKCGECYVCHIVEVSREIKRVLREDGTFWLNLGDKFFGSGGSGGDYNKGGLREGQPKYGRIELPGTWYKPKDMLGVPWHVAFALQADGWWLRSDPIWHKTNAMPEGGAYDRPSKDHEYVFMFTKNERYYYDLEENRTPHKTLEQELKRKDFFDVQNYGGNQDEAIKSGVGKIRKGRRRSDDFNPNGRSLRTVWSIPTKPYPGAHFAKFPPRLPEICIKASTSEHGVCSNCGSPYKRVLERTKHPDRDVEAQRKASALKTGRTDGHVSGPSGMIDRVKTIGWEKTCKCNINNIVPAIVLDPFVGSGTTLQVCRKLNRRGIGLDLSYRYLNTVAKSRLGISSMDHWSAGQIELEEDDIEDEQSLFSVFRV